MKQTEILILVFHIINTGLPWVTKLYQHFSKKENEKKNSVFLNSKGILLYLNTMSLQ